MIHGSRGGRTFFSPSVIATRLVVEAPGFQPQRDGCQSASMCRASRGFTFAIAGKLGGDAIDELDSTAPAVLGDLEHRPAGLGADSRDRLARFRRAIQFRPCERGEMVEIFLAQMPAAAIGQRRYVARIELGRRDT